VGPRTKSIKLTRKHFLVDLSKVSAFLGIGQHETDVFNSFHPHFFDTRPKAGWKKLNWRTLLLLAARHSTLFPRMSFYPFTGGLCFTCIFIIAQHPYLKTHSFFMQLKNPLYSQCILHGIKYQPLCCFCAPLFVFHQNYFSQENNSVWRAARVEKESRRALQSIRITTVTY
jgi:hypothetical protein